MKNKRHFLIFCLYFIIVLSLVGCKKDKETKEAVIGNGGNQINVDSLNASGGETDNEESDLKIGKEKSETIIIVINWDKITIDDVECTNIEDMKDRIVKSGCKKIDLQHIDASKETLDEVVNVLKEIEDILEIDINYN